MGIPGGISLADRTIHVCGPNALIGHASHFMASIQFCNISFVQPKGRFWSLYTLSPGLLCGGDVPGKSTDHAASYLSVWNLSPYPFPCLPRTNPRHEEHLVESDVSFGMSPGIQMTLYVGFSLPTWVLGVRKSRLNPDLVSILSKVASSTVM